MRFTRDAALDDLAITGKQLLQLARFGLQIASQTDREKGKRVNRNLRKYNIWEAEIGWRC
jgi:hypothetical protein